MEKEAAVRRCAVEYLKRQNQAERSAVIAGKCFSDTQSKEAMKHILRTCMKKKAATDQLPTLFSRKLFNKTAGSLGVAALEEGYTMQQRAAAIEECAQQHLLKQSKRQPREIFRV